MLLALEPVIPFHPYSAIKIYLLFQQGCMAEHARAADGERVKKARRSRETRKLLRRDASNAEPRATYEK